MVDTTTINFQTAVSLKRPLLQTKLNMPRMRADNIPRPRLLRKLNSAVSPSGAIHPKLTLITAPAGYGKSSGTFMSRASPLAVPPGKMPSGSSLPRRALTTSIRVPSPP